MSRPTKLNAKTRKAILAHVEIGAGLDVAGAAEGVSEFNVWAWQRKGREAMRQVELEKDFKPSRNQAQYIEFAKGVARARAAFELSILRKLDALDDSTVIDTENGPMRVSNVDPKIAAALVKSLTWLLERKRRDTYGSQITIKVEEAKEFLLNTVERVCERMGTTEVLVAILDELEGSGPQEAGAPEQSPPIH